MKQTINLDVTWPPSFSFELKEAHVVGNVIIAISSLTVNHDMSKATAKDWGELIVETNVVNPLPIKHYVLTEEENLIGCSFRLDNGEGDFAMVKSLEDIKELKNLHAPKPVTFAAPTLSTASSNLNVNTSAAQAPSIPVTPPPKQDYKLSPSFKR